VIGLAAGSARARAWSAATPLEAYLTLSKPSVWRMGAPRPMRFRWVNPERHYDGVIVGVDTILFNTESNPSAAVGLVVLNSVDLAEHALSADVRSNHALRTPFGAYRWTSVDVGGAGWCVSKARCYEPFLARRVGFTLVTVYTGARRPPSAATWWRLRQLLAFAADRTRTAQR
jgi:hypothetical protein